MNSSGDAIPGASPRRPSAARDLSAKQHPVEHPVDIDAMVVVHLGLADALARQYAGRGVDSEDLAQVARLALVRAAHRFDPLRGASFSTYATPCILGELRRYFRDVGWLVRPPRRLQELSAQQGRAEADLSLHLGRSPTATELARALGVTPETLAEVRRTSGWFHGVSLDALITDDDGALAGSTALEHLDRVDQHRDAVLAVDDREWLAMALAELTERELRVIRLRFVHVWTQERIAQQIGVSQMQVSRILRSSLERLRVAMYSSLTTG